MKTIKILLCVLCGVIFLHVVYIGETSHYLKRNDLESKKLTLVKKLPQSHMLRMGQFGVDIVEHSVERPLGLPTQFDYVFYAAYFIIGLLFTLKTYDTTSEYVRNKNGALGALPQSKKVEIDDKSIYIAGLRWDKKSLDGYHAFDEANKLAAAHGKRLPTREEFEALCKLPSCWDDKLRGRWFAENGKDLRDPERSLFLPAVGYRNLSNGTLYYQGTIGYYWASTQNSAADGQFLFFDSGGGGSPRSHSVKVGGLSVRCVAK